MDYAQCYVHDMSGKFAEISAVVQSDSPSLDSSLSLSPSDALDSAPLSSRAFISFNLLVGNKADV